jgi:hypothetical protein
VSIQYTIRTPYEPCGCGKSVRGLEVDADITDDEMAHLLL